MQLVYFPQAGSGSVRIPISCFAVPKHSTGFFSPSSSLHLSCSLVFSFVLKPVFRVWCFAVRKEPQIRLKCVLYLIILL